MPSVIFFSDTHLNPSQLSKTRRLIGFMKSRPADSVFYILGDFFDLWIGPKHIELEDYRDLLLELRKLNSSGARINLIPGNRDFTVGPEITAAAGVKVLSETFALRLGDHKVLLTHGDIFCTEDRSYQSYRRLIRARFIKSFCQSLPLKLGMRLGRRVRGYSSEVVPQKPPASRNIIDAILKRHFKKGYDVIICGHVHKPQIRQIMPDRTLFTLGDWEEGGSYVEYRDGEFIFRTL